MWHTGRVLIVVAVLLGIRAPAVSAQEQPVVFVHGVASGPDTWEETAGRLQAQLRITRPARRGLLVELAGGAER